MVPDADAVTKAEGHTSEGASASGRSIRRGQRPWHARTLRAREPGDLPPDHRPSGRLVRIGKARRATGAAGLRTVEAIGTGRAICPGELDLDLRAAAAVVDRRP